MNNPTKRIFAAVLALVMTFCAVPTAVFAASSWTAGEPAQLEIQDGTITQDELYRQLLVLFGQAPISGGNFAYDTAPHSEKRGDYWIYYGTPVDAESTEPVLLAENTTYYAARQTKSARYEDQRSFTVRSYHAVTASLAEDAPAGAGAEVSAERVYAGDTVTITAAQVPGYRTVLSCGGTAVEGGTHTYTPAASEHWTVTYVSTGPAQTPQHQVTLEITGGGWGTASLSGSGAVSEGTEITFTAVPTDNGCIASIDVAGADAAVSGFDANRAKSGSFTVGQEDVTVTVTFAEHCFPAKAVTGTVDHTPGNTGSGYVNTLRDAIFDAVVGGDNAFGLTPEDVLIEFYVNQLGTYSPLDAQSISYFGGDTVRLRITWEDASGKYPDTVWEGTVELRDSRPAYPITWNGGNALDFTRDSDVEDYIRANLEAPTEDVSIALTSGTLPTQYSTPTPVTYTASFGGSAAYRPTSLSIGLEVTRLPENFTIEADSCTVTYPSQDLLAELLAAAAVAPADLTDIPGSWSIDYQPFGDLSGMTLLTDGLLQQLQWQDIGATDDDLDALLDAMGRNGALLKDRKHTFGNGAADDTGSSTETVRIRFQSGDGSYSVTSDPFTVTLVRKDAPVPTGQIADTGRTLSLEGEIHINQYVQITGFEGVDIAQKGGLLVWDREISEEEAVFGAAGATVRAGLIPVDGEYAQRTDGIAARRYADRLYLRVYLEVAEGVYAYGPLTEYSVQQYCENKLDDAGSSPELKELCAAMLHYGTAAQVYFDDYRPYGYANANITALYPPSSWDPGLLTPAAEVPVSGICATGDVADKGRSLSLTGAVCINYYYETAFPGEAVTAELLIWDGAAGPLTSENVTCRKPLALADGVYSAQSDGICTRRYGDTIYACAHFVDDQGRDHYSDIGAYSPEQYAANKLANGTGALQEVCRRMVIFGGCAQRYFAAVNQSEKE